MSYRYEWSDEAQIDLVRVPYETAVLAADVVAEAAEDPWNYQRRTEEPMDRHFAHRWVMTADGCARVWFLIRDDQGLLWVTAVERLG